LLEYATISQVNTSLILNLATVECNKYNGSNINNFARFSFKKSIIFEYEFSNEGANGKMLLTP